MDTLESDKAQRRLQILSHHLKPAPLNLLTCSNTTLQKPQTYQYTCDGPFLTKQQRDFYERNGYLVIKNLVSTKDLKIYHDRYIGLFRLNNIAFPVVVTLVLLWQAIFSIVLFWPGNVSFLFN